MYRIKTVAERIGVPRNTLVAWERRYNLLDPARSDGGYRLYSDDDVAYLQGLKALVDEGLTISEAIARKGTRAPPPTGSDEPAPEMWAEILRFLVRYDRAGAAALLRRLEQLPFEESIATVWTPLLVELGARWEAGEVTVAEEHYASAVAREHLLAMFRSLNGGAGDGPGVVCACLPGEQHDLPLLCNAVRLGLRGWRVTWLGADVPIEDLAACCRQQAPRLLCLSTIVPASAGTVLNAARRVRALLPEETLVAVGGAGAAGLGGHSLPGLRFGEDLETVLGAV